MTRNGHIAIRSCAAAVAVAASVACGNDVAFSAERGAWQWSPYRVQFDWQITDCPQLSADVVAELRDAVAVRCRERFGPAWVATAEDVDKRFDIRLDYEAGMFAVAVREWDALLDALGLTIERQTPQRAAVADLIAGAIAEAFRPQLSIDDARTESAHVTQKAGGLFPAATLESLTRRGAAYVPIVRRFDRDGAVLEAKPIPWTLLEIDEPRRNEAVCLVHSGLANPFGIRRRGRVERTAVAVGQSSGSTTVRVTTRDGRPLAGARVAVQDGDAPAELLGATDAAGRVVVPSTDGRVRTLLITSRFQPLAKLPLMPGSVDEIAAPTIGDPELLAAEERLYAWQNRVHDAYVQRRVLIALAEGYVDAGDRAAASSALTRLTGLEDVAELLRDLESLRRRYANVADPAGRMIAALFDDAAAAVRAVDDTAELADLRKRTAAMK